MEEEASGRAKHELLELQWGVSESIYFFCILSGLRIRLAREAKRGASLNNGELNGRQFGMFLSAEQKGKRELLNC